MDLSIQEAPSRGHHRAAFWPPIGDRETSPRSRPTLAREQRRAKPRPSRRRFNACFRRRADSASLDCCFDIRHP